MSERKITTKASDGREFFGYDYEALMNGVDDYEAELALKKQKEEVEKQARIRKLEEERKVKKEAREKAMKRVEDCVDLVNQSVEKYEKETGESLTYVTVNGKLTTQKTTDGYHTNRLYIPWF